VEKNILVVTTVEPITNGIASDCDDEGFLLPKPPKMQKLPTVRSDFEWSSTATIVLPDLPYKSKKPLNFAPLVRKSEAVKQADPIDNTDSVRESEAVIDSTSSVGDEVKIKEPDLTAHERLPLTLSEGTDECAVSSTTDLDVSVKQGEILETEERLPTIVKADEWHEKCELNAMEGNSHSAEAVEKTSDEKHSTCPVNALSEMESEPMDTS
jgi:hypothetical protein